MIRVENIKKEFPLEGRMLQVLRGISFQIQEGEFVSIMGPSGSGKSTLSSILGCLATPSSGSYFLMDKDVATLSSDDLATMRNQKIGFIFQDFNLLPGLSILENVMLPLFYKKMPYGDAKKAAQAKIYSVGLAKWIDRYPAQLSGGQKQRVAIARALVGHPLFLFADEPTGALDPKTGSEIMGLLQELNAQGHTVVQVTHSLEHCKYGKRILYLDDGVLVRDELVKNPIFAMASHSGKDQIVDQAIWDIFLKDEKHEKVDFESILSFFHRVKDSGQGLIQAAQVFSRWSHEGASQATLDLFAHKDWIIRAEVVKHAKQGSEFSKELCLKAMKDPNEWVRFLALNYFRTWAYEQLSEDLHQAIIDALADPDERVRSSAVMIVKNWKDKAPIDKIEFILDDVDGRVRANAIETLEPFLSQKPHLIEKIKKNLLDANARARANAVKVILSHDKDLAVKSLLVMLKSVNSTYRVSGSWVSKFLDFEQAYSILSQHLFKEKKDGVRKMMMSSLESFIGVSLTVKELLTRLDQDRNKVG